MTKTDRRAAHPELAAFCDEMRELFGGQITYVSIPGYEWGERGDVGVVPNVREKEKRNMKKQSGGASIGFLGLLFIVFMTLKLCAVIDWSWWWVTAPLWGGFALVFAVTFAFLAFTSK